MRSRLDNLRHVVGVFSSWIEGGASIIAHDGRFADSSLIVQSVFVRGRKEIVAEDLVNWRNE
jgi:hypothetical protein